MNWGESATEDEGTGRIPYPVGIRSRFICYLSMAVRRADGNSRVSLSDDTIFVPWCESGPPTSKQR